MICLPAHGSKFLAVKFLAVGATLAGILEDDGPTSLTLRLPGGVEQTLLRKDVQGVRRTAVSLIPSFAESITPADMASLLAWLKNRVESNPEPQEPPTSPTRKPDGH